MLCSRTISFCISACRYAQNGSTKPRTHQLSARCFVSSANRLSGRHVVDKKLFTPGPLGVSWSTKQAMLRDLGSRDKEFIAVVKHIRHELLELAG